ncbi:choice-of-anchor B family protein [Gracilimonas sp. Q87]|uniref:choice-of-anchor B family protein n=1 Tax=Gracilimonas sp. Q87 TaxID=3384766 RepID=UPI0039842474
MFQLQEYLLLGVLFICLAILSACESSSTDGAPDSFADNPTTQAEAPYPCEDGQALNYDCGNVDLFAHLNIYELSGIQNGVYLNDIWGWTDPKSEKEYALVGLTNGVSFVDISDPDEPVVVARLPESDLRNKYKSILPAEYPACNLGIGATQRSKALGQGSSWRDIKVYDDHAFVVSDAQPHGMQVLDLTKLRDYSGEVLNLEHDFLYERLSSAHNIVINEETGYAYATGVTQAEICGSRDESGLHMIDIREPKNPTFAGCYVEPTTSYAIAPGYVHDAQCIIYDGPDNEHTGKEICFNSAEGNVLIADVTDKNNPRTISMKSQANMQYSHQGWLTEDQAYFLMNDELDERNLMRNTKTYIWDVRDLDDPLFIGYYEHQTFSIDHNLYVKGEHVYQANYNAGLQIMNISNIANGELERTAYFDTQPGSDASLFEGTWSNYPYFKSGMVVLSDIENGLFIVRPRL